MKRLQTLGMILALAGLPQPAMALSCPSDGVVGQLRRLPPADAKVRAEQLVKKVIDQASAVVSAVPVSVRYLGGAESNSPVSVVTFRIVKEWKGPGEKHIAAIFYDWCDASCDELAGPDNERALLERAAEFGDLLVLSSAEQAPDMVIDPPVAYQFGVCRSAAHAGHPLLEHAWSVELDRMCRERAK